MATGTENALRAEHRAREVFEDTAAKHKAFNAGQESVPGVPFVSREPLTTEEIIKRANEIRKRNGLGPLPPRP